MTENYNTGGWNKDVLGGKKIKKLTIEGAWKGGGQLFGTREQYGTFDDINPEEMISYFKLTMRFLKD